MTTFIINENAVDHVTVENAETVVHKEGFFYFQSGDSSRRTTHFIANAAGVRTIKRADDKK